VAVEAQPRCLGRKLHWVGILLLARQRCEGRLVEAEELASGAKEPLGLAKPALAAAVGQVLQRPAQGLQWLGRCARGALGGQDLQALGLPLASQLQDQAGLADAALPADKRHRCAAAALELRDGLFELAQRSPASCEASPIQIGARLGTASREAVTSLRCSAPNLGSE